MRGLVKHAWLLLTVPLVVAVALGLSAEPGAVVLGALAAVAVAAVLVARAAALVVGADRTTVGERARQHRESLVGLPEPQHPGTPGRPRTRAPAGALPAA